MLIPDYGRQGGCPHDGIIKKDFFENYEKVFTIGK